MRATALVTGASGFIGAQLVDRLKRDGLDVTGVDVLPAPAHPGRIGADRHIQADLRDSRQAFDAIAAPVDELYHLAADMGGAGYVFTGANDHAILESACRIDGNVLAAARAAGVARLLYASSACVYPQDKQADPAAPACAEANAYPANPDSFYGWAKLNGEHLVRAFGRNTGLATRIARYHNVYGPGGAFAGGREKAPAALCRKVALAEPGAAVEVWGDGEQTRSFLYIADALDATTGLMRSDMATPLNIGSAEMVTINDLLATISAVAGKPVTPRHVPGPQGVRGRTSDNRLIRAQLGWEPRYSLRAGLAETYRWIAGELGRADAPGPAPAPEAAS